MLRTGKILHLYGTTIMMRNEYELAVFVKNEDGTFDRFEEQHYQHGFTIDEVTGAVNKAGLTVKNVYNAFTKDMPDDKSERLYFVIEK